MPHLRLVKQANRLRRLLQVRPNTRPITVNPGGFSHDIVLRADPKRGIPERNVGMIQVDSQGQVHMSAIDPALQGSGLAAVAYKRLAQQMPGGRLYGDNLQSPGSFGLWNSMANSSAAAELAGVPPLRRAQVIPLDSVYRSEGGGFMSAQNKGPNWGLRMPPASLTTSAPYRGSLPSPFGWPTAAAGDLSWAAGGTPFRGGAVRSWENYPAQLRTVLGQPQFPPSARGSFSDVDRLARNVVQAVNQSGSAGTSPKDAVIRRLTESFAAKGVSPEQGVQQLREVLKRNQERTTAAVNAKLGKGGKPTQDPAPTFQVLDPVVPRAGQKPTGYVVKPLPVSTSGAAAQAATPAPRQTAIQRRLLAQAAPTPAPPQPGTQLALPAPTPAPSQPGTQLALPPSNPGGFAGVTGPGGGFPPFSGLNRPPPPPPSAPAPTNVGRVVEDWFSRAQELPAAASTAMRNLKDAWFAAGKNK